MKHVETAPTNVPFCKVRHGHGEIQLKGLTLELCPYHRIQNGAKEDTQAIRTNSHHNGTQQILDKSIHFNGLFGHQVSYRYVDRGEDYLEK